MGGHSDHSYLFARYILQWQVQILLYVLVKTRVISLLVIKVKEAFIRVYSGIFCIRNFVIVVWQNGLLK